jgi:hypothetical protein
MGHGDAMTQTDYEREALNQLESADNFRKILATIYEDKPLDYAMVGALKAGIRYSLDAAQTYATLATIAHDRAELVEIQLAELKARRGGELLAFEEPRRLPSYGGGILPPPADGRY